MGFLLQSASQFKASLSVLKIASFLFPFFLTWAIHLSARLYGIDDLLFEEHVEAPQAYSTYPL